MNRNSLVLSHFHIDAKHRWWKNHLARIFYKVSLNLKGVNGRAYGSSEKNNESLKDLETIVGELVKMEKISGIQQTCDNNSYNRSLKPFLMSEAEEALGPRSSWLTS